MTSPIVHLDGRYLPLDEARISPEDRGFLFGDGVYESLRYYPVSTDVAATRGLFAVDRHLARLRRSLHGIQLGGVDVDAIPPIAAELLDRNGLRDRDASVYLQITRGAAPRQHAFPGELARPTVYAIARPFDPPHAQWEHGIGVALVDDVRWGRCDVKSIALLANVLASEEARARGATEAVFVREGEITEGAHTAVAFVQEGRLRTHPETARILPSVTRALVLELCERLGIEIDERPLRRSELGDVQEMIVLGTTTEVMPVVRVDGEPVASGTPGPLTRRLQEAYRGLRG
jgi:D-alanine transaminase